ncbi:neprosin family prolyl endopeptidase [Bradyrhizobium erythrophlei]|nr:neprosin family prolyl endopeptidase [Bradyrhizobium erythrophlei]
MTTSVNRPRYVETKGQGHSLNEIAVQGGTKADNIAEVGWIVSTDFNGDADPHIFVFHWVDGIGKGYDGYGWVQFSNRYYPTQNISALVGREIYVGYVLYKGNWWAWFDGDWLGYFPESLWGTNFGTATLVQWFGEVATDNGVPPQIEMGDGKLPPPPTAAHMFNVCDVDVTAWTCFVRNDQQISPPAAPKFYSISQTGFGDLRYGGPGQ